MKKDEKANIVSYLKIGGEWVEQSTIPKEQVRRIVKEVITRAGDQIGFEVTDRSDEAQKQHRRKTAW